jgi:hypothetical protein
MKASELRIGNWTSAGRVNEILEEKFYVHDGESSLSSAWFDIQPVKLAEEWFLKLGFKKEDKDPASKHHGPYYSIWIHDYKYSFSYADFRDDWGFYHSYTDALKDEDNDKFDFISCGIKYVHQLQNLFFALTGTELIITE